MKTWYWSLQSKMLSASTAEQDGESWVRGKRSVHEGVPVIWIKETNTTSLVCPCLCRATRYSCAML